MADASVYSVGKDVNGHTIVMRDGKLWVDATTEMQEMGVVVEGDHIAAVAPHLPSAPDFAQDIAEFHTRFGQAYNGPPRAIPPDLAEFRIGFMLEELRELIAAETNADALDALVDLVYVAIGTAYLAGWDFNEAWRRVHAANMAKIPAAPGEFKIRKPEGWQPPDHRDLVP